jgi:Ca-activated chloride channel family protein
VVIDTSKSMLAEDLKPNRLQQAKWGVRDLLRQLKGDRVGLVAFAGSSFLQCPLTIDYAALTMTLDDLYAGIIPRGGTAIEQALRVAIKSFDASRESAGADRAIVLITDGDDHEGDPLKTLDELKERGIRLYAIGVGSPEGELIPAPDPKSDAGFVKDRDGKVVKSRLHEDVLKRLALGTGGAYVRSAPGDTGLDRVFRESIDQLKRDERESRMAKVHEDRYMWLLGAAWMLLLVEAVVTERRRTREEWTG